MIIHNYINFDNTLLCRKNYRARSFGFRILQTYCTPITARVVKSQKMIIFWITIPDCTPRGKREVVFLSP